MFQAVRREAVFVSIMHNRGSAVWLRRAPDLPPSRGGSLRSQGSQLMGTMRKMYWKQMLGSLLLLLLLWLKQKWDEDQRGLSPTC